MCILFKLQYAKFGVSNFFFFKSYRRKIFGGSAGTPLDKGRVKRGCVKAVLFEQTLVPFGLLFYCRKGRQNFALNVTPVSVLAKITWVSRCQS